jgi:hypothetical protein
LIGINPKINNFEQNFLILSGCSKSYRVLAIYPQVNNMLTNTQIIDERVSDGFYQPKSTLPFGQLPVLEVNGTVVIPQTVAITRYLAREHRLSGKRITKQINFAIFLRIALRKLDLKSCTNAHT